MNTTLIVSLVLVIVLVWGISLYNRLVSSRNRTREAWSGIDVSLAKRYDLVPNLVATVKGYATHEKETLEKVISYRTASVNANTIGEKAAAAGGLTSALGSLMAVAEAYPELKADANFRQLQSELADIEHNLESARRYYNGTARENNNMVERFPSNILAGMFAFKASPYWEVADTAHRERPAVSF